MNLVYWRDTAKLWVKVVAEKVAVELTVWFYEFVCWLIYLFPSKKGK